MLTLARKLRTRVLTHVLAATVCVWIPSPTRQVTAAIAPMGTEVTHTSRTDAKILMSALKMLMLAAMGSVRTHRGITPAHATQEVLW